MSSWYSGEARVPAYPLPEQPGQDQEALAGTQVRLERPQASSFGFWTFGYVGSRSRIFS